MKIRVGFPLAGNERGWLGGINYVANLVQAIVAGSNGIVEPVIITSHKPSEGFRSMFAGVEIIESSYVAGRNLKRIGGKFVETTIGRNAPYEAQLRRSNIDVMSHCAPIGRKSSIPTIAWVPDLQHRQRPDFFSAAELKRRDHNIRHLVEKSTLVILSSENAKAHMLNFIPSCSSKLRVLHFVSALNSSTELRTSEDICSAYNIPARYIYMPNQFWRHKNHEIVIRALEILRTRGVPICIVSTGETTDYRDPDHFPSIERAILDRKLDESFRILGVVPYGDVRSLMANATGVINPSQFEGWSTSVEEGKSFGKRIVLSDIEVHREQDPPRALYFDPNSAEGLASALFRHATEYNPDDDYQSGLEASAMLRARHARFGHEYARIVVEAAGVCKQD